MRYSYKFNIMNSSKSLLPRFYSTNRNIQRTAKNHYDTLKITPYATQNEVKSAYYKLTLQYHPDKNKSDYAKQKFQEISDAYEVLSSHESRKNYDRRMLIRQQPMSSVERPPPRYKTSTSNTRIYNFDEWTHAHYSEEFYNSRMRRKIYKDNIRSADTYEINNDIDSKSYIALLVTVLIIIVAVSFKKDPDVPGSKTKRHVEKNVREAN